MVSTTKWNPMRRCSCGMCRRGLHRGNGFGYIAQRGWRKFRRETKAALRMGYEPPRFFAIGYTD